MLTGSQAEAADFPTRSLAASWQSIDIMLRHISEVFLSEVFLGQGRCSRGEERVFEPKRTVRFPYLDFSTAGRRRAMCLAEFDLDHERHPMNTTFDERERAFESRFAHDEEQRFRARARRNRLLAAWAIERMRLTGDAAAGYVTSFTEGAVVASDEALLARLQTDLRACGIEEPLPNLRGEMDRCRAVVAAEQRVGLALDQGSSV